MATSGPATLPPLLFKNQNNNKQTKKTTRTHTHKPATVDGCEIHVAPSKKPLNDLISQRKYQQKHGFNHGFLGDAGVRPSTACCPHPWKDDANQSSSTHGDRTTHSKSVVADSPCNCFVPCPKSQVLSKRQWFVGAGKQTVRFHSNHTAMFPPPWYVSPTATATLYARSFMFFQNTNVGLSGLET